ncbi:hypothetical protein SAMN05428987_5581 [Paenibacillus sp. CF095]|nr:hypothetical protein SAMN05428987_5581 [Paenibacillus sp. CF095]
MPWKWLKGAFFFASEKRRICGSNRLFSVQIMVQ